MYKSSGQKHDYILTCAFTLPPIGHSSPSAIEMEEKDAFCLVNSGVERRNHSLLRSIRGSSVLVIGHAQRLTSHSLALMIIKVECMVMMYEDHNVNMKG